MRREKRRAEFEERYLAARERLREKRERKNSSLRSLRKFASHDLGDDTGGWQTERRDENRTKLSAAGFNLGVK
jgi:hypothetical protein